MHNEHKEAIPAEVLAEIEDHLKQVLRLLEPYRTPLTTEERKNMIIIGDKTLAFLEKGKEYIELYPALVPAWSSKDDFTIDFQDVHNITPIINLAGQVQDAIYDIHYVAGSEAYHWVLDLYHSVKQAAARDVPNAKLVYTELGKRFQRTYRRPPTGEAQA